MSDPRPPAEVEARPAPGGPDDRLLGWRRVKDITGISRSTAWRLQRTGAFPEAVQISPGRIAWWQSDLEAWKRSRAPRRLTPSAMTSPRPQPQPQPQSRSQPQPEPQPQRARGLIPARTPALPGLARSMPAPPAAAPGSKPAPAAATGRGRRRRAASSPDQFDFGF